MARSTRLAAPPRWESARLEKDRAKAIAIFREERITEPLEKYTEVVDDYLSVFENLLELTVDLRELSNKAIEILSDPQLTEALRYLPGPFISLDDLKVVADAPSFTKKALKADPELAHRIVQVALDGLDRRRFPWISEDREATEQERASAVLASAALFATNKVVTDRRNEGKNEQEANVKRTLTQYGFTEVPARSIQSLATAPDPGQFCGECLLGERKADIVVGLWDQRVLAMECKVSNSATNSIKRLNNDAAAKAQAWRQDFGETQVIPAVVLSGVFKLKNLEDAQDRHLSIFWEHSLVELTEFIGTTKNNV